jgi:hypothetical protein
MYQMVKIYLHLTLSVAIGIVLFLLKPELGFLPLILFVLADGFLDIDHLIKHKGVKNIYKNYNKCNEYYFHKIWIIFPVASIALLTPAIWFGIGLLIHFSLDFIENHILFKGKFKWV